MYHDLAPWWPLLSAPSEYAEEAEIYRRLLVEAGDRPPVTMLELGSGGGNNASHLKAHFELTLVDRGGHARGQPGGHLKCEHVQGDIRGRSAWALGVRRRVVHDAVMYMTTAEDLRLAIETAFVHCRPGGAALFAPDHLREHFRTGTDYGGHDGDQRAVRFLEWTWDPDPLDTTYTVDYAYLLRDADGSVRVEHDRHVEGLFPRADLAGAAGRRRLRGQSGPGGALGAGAGQLRAVRRHQAERVRTGMKLIGRRRVLWDYLGGALWVLPTVAVVVFLTAGALLSRVPVDADSPLAAGLPGHGRGRPRILIVVSAT